MNAKQLASVLAQLDETHQVLFVDFSTGRTLDITVAFREALSLELSKKFRVRVAREPDATKSAQISKRTN